MTPAAAKAAATRAKNSRAAARKEELKKIKPIPIELITLSANPLRPLVDEEVKRLAASMQRIGLKTPITLRYFPCVDDESTGVAGTPYEPDYFRLVTGRHRLAAAELLGWELIDAIEIECSDVDARLWEIAENLHRAELTKLQHDEQVAEWIKLTESKSNASQVATHKKGQQPGGINAAARELGIDKDAAHRAIKVAGLSDEAKAAAIKHGLDDNRDALLEARRAGNDPSAQVAKIVARAAKPKAGPVHVDADEGGDNESFLIAADEPGAAGTNKLINKVLGFWEGIDPAFTAWVENDPDPGAVRALCHVAFEFAKDLHRRSYKKVYKQRRADSKAYKDYGERFGPLGVFIFDPDNMRLVRDSLASGIDHLAGVKRENEEYAEQHDRDQEEFQRTPITAETEQRYTAMITHRGLYEGACMLAWPMYFKYRDEHPDLPPLTPDDLAYAGMWTSCATDVAQP
jgi:ParB-like chromosome segregation protein Spo0J